VLLVFVLVVSCVAGGTLVAARYQGVPSALTPSTSTYTPPQGPSSPLLLASRPERVFQVYLAAYIRLAGTYPCQANLSMPYYGDNTDPLLNGKPCAVRRPVAGYTITRVTVRSRGLFRQSDARLHIVVTYADGTQWEDDEGLIPDEYQVAWGVYYTHLDCWSSFGTLQVFGRLVPDVPTGAEYSKIGGGPYYCKH
jgi:hypothetical protein